jgi:hypothetical protein
MRRCRGIATNLTSPNVSFSTYNYIIMYGNLIRRMKTKKTRRLLNQKKKKDQRTGIYKKKKVISIPFPSPNVLSRMITVFFHI